MLGIERRQKIMDILQKNKKVYVAKLAQEFGITEIFCSVAMAVPCLWKKPMRI